MKKIILYFLAFIGTLAILFFIAQWFSTAGKTMYGGSPVPMQAVVGKPDYAVGTVAMSNTNPSSGTQSSENVMRGMIIRNANISLQVNNINFAVEKIAQLAENSGGYVVSSNVTQDNDSNNTNANISIRVPAQGLNKALTALKSLATQVMQESITGEDITQQFVDLQSQLSNLQKAKEQLSKIMNSATNKKEIAALAGVAPITKDSGKQRGRAITQKGRNSLRKILYMGALSAIRYDRKIKELYHLCLDDCDLF